MVNLHNNNNYRMMKSCLQIHLYIQENHLNISGSFEVRLTQIIHNQIAFDSKLWRCHRNRAFNLFIFYGLCLMSMNFNQVVFDIYEEI